jgi:hypothetical protein
MTTYYLWLLIFAIFLYLVVTDMSIAQLIVICSQWWRLQYEKLKWWVLYNPDNPIVRWNMHRKSMKMAEELMKEFEREKNI